MMAITRELSKLLPEETRALDQIHRTGLSPAAASRCPSSLLPPGNGRIFTGQLGFGGMDMHRWPSSPRLERRRKRVQAESPGERTSLAAEELNVLAGRLRPLLLAAHCIDISKGLSIHVRAKQCFVALSEMQLELHVPIRPDNHGKRVSAAGGTNRKTDTE
ncbi:hypothetical protein TgHK011_008471 [Trichoderma gracile]|nr:hypothetical protein TgHK011_008471 [Trichoderma gracile]